MSMKNTSAVYEHIEVVPLKGNKAYPEHSWTTTAISLLLESDVMTVMTPFFQFLTKFLINLFCFVGHFGRAEAGQHQQEFPSWSLWVEARDILNSKVSIKVIRLIHSASKGTKSPAVHLLVRFRFLFRLFFSILFVELMRLGQYHIPHLKSTMAQDRNWRCSGCLAGGYWARMARFLQPPICAPADSSDQRVIHGGPKLCISNNLSDIGSCIFKHLIWIHLNNDFLWSISDQFENACSNSFPMNSSFIAWSCDERWQVDCKLF